MTEPATPEPLFQPPPGLSADAEDAFLDVTEANPGLSSQQFAALIQATRLISLADRAEVALGDAFIVAGASGQLVASGLLSEIRLSRSAAVTALRVAGLSSSPSGRSASSSAAGSALASARWGKSR